jgi:hypothetical protein
MTETFDPNQVTFDEGVERIRRAVREAGLRVGDRVLTSRDKDVKQAQAMLGVSAVPGGFRKSQLPVYLSNPSQLFITIAEPNAEVPEHSHNEGDGIRFIAGGSIHYEGKELGPGDWMFIPAGTSYSFRVGANGAIMCYCYCCCCAGRADLFDPSIWEQAHSAPSA